VAPTAVELRLHHPLVTTCGGKERTPSSLICLPPLPFAMSQVRVHNFSISLDGFGTGDDVTFDAPFGHAGERLHDWMFATPAATGLSGAGWAGR
jgi:hypothetical protein